MDGDQVVQYLIFEFADGGDIRKYFKLSQKFDTAWALRALHHIATGLQQLHSQEIAHQDLKPSNVLVFSADRVSKLADLGRASARGQSPPHEEFQIAGDPEYAPLEFYYGHVPADWVPRRLGCDAYHLGAMSVFLFGGANITALVLDELDRSFRPLVVGGEWRGPYAEVLPVRPPCFRFPFSSDMEAISTLARHTSRTRCLRWRGSSANPIRLCGATPVSAPGANPFSLQRYISTFDRLAVREELRLRSR